LIVICSIVRTELLFGAYRSVQPTVAVANIERFRSPFGSAEFNDAAATQCAQLRSVLVARNAQIGPYDSLIAATSLVHGHTLVTRNTAEFSRVPALSLENWQ
jgi:tRNA(fMet)-specific endonuclease VapC